MGDKVESHNKDGSKATGLGDAKAPPRWDCELKVSGGDEGRPKEGVLVFQGRLEGGVMLRFTFCSLSSFPLSDWLGLAEGSGHLYIDDNDDDEGVFIDENGTHAEKGMAVFRSLRCGSQEVELVIGVPLADIKAPLVRALNLAVAQGVRFGS